MMRSHYCGQLNESLDGQEITLCGWVHRRRDHGGVIFLDIRDREGLAQVVFDPDRAETFAKADRVRSEYVVKITGKVRLRPAGAVNPNMASGAIEVLGYELDVLNEAETPPFPLNEYTDVGEETRLRYRFVDGGRVREYHYQAEQAPEIVPVGEMSYSALRVSRTNGGNDEMIIWVADGVPTPVRILQREDGEDAIDLRLVEYQGVQ